MWIRAVSIILGFYLFTVTVVAQDESQPGYQYTTKGTRIFSNADQSFLAKILVEDANLGSEEVKVAELTFPSGYAGSGHLHGAIEIFYVLSGRFGHSVNGVDAVLGPGEIGIVKPGDTVIHSVHSEEPAVVLTIWVPGGEGAPSFSGLVERPIETGDGK